MKETTTGNAVAEVVPLKQGLKQHIYFVVVISSYIVAEVVPLKQGLKPY